MKIVPIIQIRHRDGPRGRCPFGDLHHTMCQVYSAPPGAAGPNKTIRRRQVNDSRAQIANPRESAVNCLTAVFGFFRDIAQSDGQPRPGTWAR